MNEIKHNETVEQQNSFQDLKQVDKRLDKPEVRNTETKVENYNPDQRIKVVEKVSEAVDYASRKADFLCKEITGKAYSELKMRIDRTPKEGTFGNWTGERGESKYVATQFYIKEELQKYGLDGIEYRGGIPDFSKCCVAEAKIPQMTPYRYKNLNLARTEFAKQWNKEKKDGRTDWTAREVMNWQKENRMTIHECSDRKTVQMVPRVIHDAFRHSGGVCECRIKEEKKDELNGKN